MYGEVNNEQIRSNRKANPFVIPHMSRDKLNLMLFHQHFVCNDNKTNVLKILIITQSK